MKPRKPVFSKSLLHPRYWATWLLMGFWWLFCQLPFPILRKVGAGLGRLMYWVGGSRRRIVERNLELCFPEMAAQQRHELVRKNFENYGIGVFEVAIPWWWSDRRFNRLVTISGVENLDKLQGRGALLMAMHFTSLELGGQALASRVSMDAMYRRHDNPVYEYVQSRGRLTRSPDSQVFPRKDVRGVAKALRQGRIIWYAPDQDYGPSGSVFAPFFGIPAASVSATAKLARMGNAGVVPFTNFRRADGSGYDVVVHPPLEDFPTGDDVADASRINQLIEGFIRQHPEQYLWAHRRFKTRPPGDPSLYRKDR